MTIDNALKNNADKKRAAIRLSYDKFVNLLDIQNFCVLNSELLNQMALSWVLDEERHIDFHNCNGIMRHKSAAYFMYWFVRIKPIQVRIDLIPTNNRVTLVNELFTLFKVYDMLEIDSNRDICDDFNEELVYMLRFRSLNPETLITTMNLLEKAAKSKALK